MNTPYTGRDAVPAVERSHHAYGPSTLQSTEACSNYQSRQSKTPHPRTVIGTIAHNSAETGEDDNRLTDDDAEHVAACIDFYEERKRLIVEDRERYIQSTVDASLNYKEDRESLEQLAEQEVPQIIEIKESYLPVDDLEFTDILSGPYGDGKTPVHTKATTAGYIDSALIDHTGTYAEIFDWKFGRWPVEYAKNNLQGIAYALGMFKAYPKLEEVRYFFKQPLIDYITDAVITRDEIPAHYLRIQIVVAKARAARKAGDFATATPHVPACNFCAHLGTCPAVAAIMLKVGKKFSPVEIPDNITPTMVYDEKDTAIGLKLAELAILWGGAFKGVITNRVLTRMMEPPAGYTIASRTPRKIKDATKYREIALRYLTDVEYATTLKASFGAVEEIISDKAPRGQKKISVEKFGVEIEECGAAEKGEGYSFLQAVPKKPNT